MSQRMSKLLFSGYIFGAPIYILINAYADSKCKLEKYRNKQLDSYQTARYKTEFEAAKGGITENIPLHIMMSIAWPLFAPIMAIPYIVTNTMKVNSGVNGEDVVNGEIKTNQ